MLDYARNRALRIYPALIVCTLTGVANVFIVGYLSNDTATIPKFIAWVLGQITIAQFFSPRFIRGYGTGAFNGNLGTATTELQFYVLAPITYMLFRLKQRTPRSTNVILGFLIFLFVLANAEFNRRDGQQVDLIYMKVLDVSFIPWFYMFLLGVLVQRNFDQIPPFVRGRALLFGVTYVAAALFVRDKLNWRVSNAIHPLLFLILATFVLSCAYTAPMMAVRLLRRNDYSYGIYI